MKCSFYNRLRMASFNLSCSGGAIVLISSLVIGVSSLAQTHSLDSTRTKTVPDIASLGSEVRADMAFLADDELHGRGSATRDEHIAALFAASQFASFRLEPGGDNGTFLEKTALPESLPPRTQQNVSRLEDT